MDGHAAQMITKIENQLAQLILYAGAITALSERAKINDGPHDPFLFGTIYEALWDAAIVRLDALWDVSKNVASFPRLVLQLDSMGSVEFKAVAKQIRNSASPERERLKLWRNKVVAHAQHPFDPVDFDANYSVNVRDLEAELKRAEALLAAVSRSLGERPVYFEILKSDANENARRSLAKWQL